MTATCTECGAPFTQLADWVTICPDCSDADSGTCQECGAPIAQNDAGARRKFCDQCAADAILERSRARATGKGREPVKRWLACGFHLDSPGQSPRDWADISDWLGMRWDDIGIVSDLTAEVIPPGLMILSPAGITGIVCKCADGLTVRRLGEVMR